jgi:hypothetical protein
MKAIARLDTFRRVALEPGGLRVMTNTEPPLLHQRERISALLAQAAR